MRASDGQEYWITLLVPHSMPRPMRDEKIKEAEEYLWHKAKVPREKNVLIWVSQGMAPGSREVQHLDARVVTIKEKVRIEQLIVKSQRHGRRKHYLEGQLAGLFHGDFVDPNE